MKRALVLIAVLVLGMVCAAQTPDTATVSGQILDQTRAAVPGVLVTVTNALTGLQRSATTGNSGLFSLGGLPVAGEYRIVAAKHGFADVTLNEIRLVGGRSAKLDITLTAAGVRSEVTVTGAAGEVRADQPQLGNYLSSAQIQETPLLNRRITYLPLLNAANRPAINQGDVFMNENLFNTNGTGRRQTLFVIDGSYGSDAWGRQTIFTNVPEDAVQEMTVLTNAFSAEYGFTAGTVVNMVTRSGGERFHGDVLGMWRPADTAASLSGFTATSSNASGNAIVTDTLRQAAAAFSGPIGSSGRTHFYTAGEYNWQNRGSPIISPLAPGIFVGHYRGWLAFLRLDHQINNKHNLFLRGDVDSFRDSNPNGTVGGNNLPSVDRIFRRRTYAVEGGETAVLSPSLLNNLRLQFQLASPITAFDPVVFGTQFVVPIAGAATFTSGTSQSASLLNRQYEVGDTLSAVRGRHTWKFGADVLHARNGGNSKEFGGPIFLGSFTYNLCSQPVAACESAAYLNNLANVKSYTQSYGNANYVVGDTMWSLFVQDDYRLRPNLTLNMGLRYERQTFTDAARNFAPRVGFAYNWRGDGKTVIRGGFGIYYSQVVDNAAANYALGGPKGVFNFTAGPGQVGFPASVAAAPLPAFPAGAVQPVRDLYIRPGQGAFLDQFFSTSSLIGYPKQLLNPYTQQWTFGLERQVASHWVLAVDYVGAHTLKINRPLDVNPPAPFVRTLPGQIRSAQAANCTRPLWVLWYAQHNLACNPNAATNPQPPYRLIQTDVNNGFAHYNALDVNLSHRFSERLSMLASYTWSHATDNVDPDIPGQNPNDPNFTGAAERGDAIFDQRHRFVLSGSYVAPLKITIGGVSTLASGVPFNIVTGSTNSGDTGGTTDRPVVNGIVLSHNAGRGKALYDVSPFVERPFAFGERVQLKLRAEAFNVINHANFIGYNGTWGNGATAAAGFGQPLVGITAQLPARSMQFSARLSF
jgi:hypothetical protein